MKIPSSRKELGQWAVQLADQCNVSVARRVNDCILWRSYFLDGAPPGKQALFNKTNVHLEQLASELFSPAETRFWLERNRYAPSELDPILEEASNVLTEHFQNDRIGIAFQQALPWALAFGKAFIKIDWRGTRVKPYVVMPYEIGVYREDYETLEDQEAICQTFYITMQEFKRMLQGHPREATILKEVEGRMSSSSIDEGERGYHRIFMGGTQPIITQGSPQPAGFASLRPNAPVAEVAPEVADQIIKLQELWVWDDDRDDWTTIQFVSGGVIVEGDLQHRNLFIPGLLPFSEVCPNPTVGNFWGLSEISTIRKLQDALNDRIADVLFLQELEIRRPRAYIGFEGLTDEKMAALRKPNGFITESSFQAKIEDLAPKVEGDVHQSVHELIGMFDDIAGLTAITQGHGESGVRSRGHAETLVRMSTPRLRDRALLVEAQVAELGDLVFKLLQEKDPHIHQTIKQQEFYLKDVPEDSYTVAIDAHSSSPVFVKDALSLATILLKEGAIDQEDFLRLTHPPLFTTLITRLRQRKAAEAKFMQEHPELALEGGRKGAGKHPHNKGGSKQTQTTGDLTSQ